MEEKIANLRRILIAVDIVRDLIVSSASPIDCCDIYYDVAHALPSHLLRLIILHHEAQGCSFCHYCRSAAGSDSNSGAVSRCRLFPRSVGLTPI